MSSGRTKTHSTSGPRELSRCVGELPRSRRLGCQIASGHQPREYTTLPPAVKPFRVNFLCIFCASRPIASTRGDEPGVATLSNLEDLVVQEAHGECEPFIAYGLAVESYSAPPDEPPGFAVGPGKPGEGDKVYDPDLVGARQC